MFFCKLWRQVKAFFIVDEGPEAEVTDPQTLVKMKYPKAQCHLEVSPDPTSQYCCWCIYLDGNFSLFACGQDKSGAWKNALSKIYDREKSDIPIKVLGR